MLHAQTEKDVLYPAAILVVRKFEIKPQELTQAEAIPASISPPGGPFDAR